MATKTFDRLWRLLNFVSQLCCLTLLSSSYTTPCMYRVGLAGAQSNSLEERASKALELAQSGNLESAEDELRKVVALEPDNGEFLQELGTVLAMEK